MLDTKEEKTYQLKDVIGHRGAAGYEPENTLGSFQKAIELGVATIELDVFVCASGELVVLHDEQLEVVTTGKGSVRETSLADIRQLKVKNDRREVSSEGVPTLDEVIALVKDKVTVVIELKGPDTAEKVARYIGKCIEDGQHADDFLVSSFKKTELRTFQALMPQISVGVLLWGMPSDEELDVYQKWGAHSVHIDWNDGDVSRDLVERVHMRGMQIFAYTVNDLSVAKRMKHFGVDKIFSDVPDVVGL